MIKVIVAVAGLALVEAPHEGPIDIHLPETEGFYSPVPLLTGDGRPRAFSVDRHLLELGYGDKKAKPRTSTSPSDLRIVVAVAGSFRPAPLSLDPMSYVSLDEALPTSRSTVRSECGFSADDPFDDCRAINAKGGKSKLLAGQIRLEGPWRAVLPISFGGLYYQGKNHQLRLLIDDEDRSTVLGVPIRHYVDTFFFETEVESLESVSIEDSLFARKVHFYDPGSDVCEAFQADRCLMLRVENAPDCRRNDPKRPCAEVSTFLQRADTHLAQLYRLTSAYEPNSGMIVDPIYTLVGSDTQTHGHPKIVIMGNGSPKCYGGYISP
jgi:hypothetical protein